MNALSPSVAYLLVVHKDPPQLLRLMRAISHPQNWYAVHVDKTAPRELHQAAFDLATSDPRIIRLPSINCRHAGFSLVRVQQMAIRKLLRAGVDWSHFVNLSGEDFPLVSQSEILNELGEANGKSFIQVFDPWDPQYWNDADDRFDGLYWEPLRQKKAQRIGNIRIRRRWLLGGAKIFGGSQWSILSRNFCEYVTTFRNFWHVALFFRTTYVPDETFYQTIIMNSHFRESIVNDNRRYIDWTTGPERPRVLRIDDYGRLIDSNALFARKLNIQVDESIISKLEQRILDPRGSIQKWVTDA